MKSQDLKATYREIFKTNLIRICHSNQAYIKDYKLQEKLKAQLDSTLRFHKLHSKRPINLLFYSPLTLEFDIRKLLRFYRKKRNVRIFYPKWVERALRRCDIDFLCKNNLLACMNLVILHFGLKWIALSFLCLAWIKSCGA